MTSYLTGGVPSAARRRIERLDESQLVTLGEVERSPGKATDYALGRLEALRYSCASTEDVARIDAALARVTKAKRTKRTSASATKMADAGVAKAFAKYDLDDDDEDLLG
jgi:hypothetical protein